MRTDDRADPPTRSARVNCVPRRKQCRVALSSQRSRRWMFTLVFGTIVALFVLTLIHLPPSRLDAALFHARVRNEPPFVTLLIWWRPFGTQEPLPDCAVSYGIQGCTLTDERHTYDQADAVIVHNAELMRNWSALPRAPRPRHQKWIWMNFESPSHSGWLAGFDGLFNLTMSYRQGSDIFMPYGYLKPRDGDGEAPQVHARHGLVAWIVSNWNQHHERVRFFRRLRKYIQVDVYGRAGQDLISNSVTRTVSRYKFYLAFENSVHTDYITEKLWRNALVSGAVPVVLGPPRENYERFLPAGAFIHVEDFRSPLGLATYLKHLDRHPALYQRYHTWRQHYSVHVTSFWSEHYCMACRAVQASRHQNKAATNLAVWFES